MSSNYRHGPSADEVATDTFDDELCRDAARYLARDLDPTPLIRGISDHERLQAFRAVERRLYEGGRDDVLAALDDRLAVLEGGT